MSVTFLEFFNGALNNPSIDNSYESEIDADFIEVANELFNEFVPIPNAIYRFVNSDVANDPATPWEVEFGSHTDYSVKLIVFPSEIEGRRYSRYREGTEVPFGSIKVLMQRSTQFEPKQKDFILLRGRSYKLTSIDPIAPLYRSICHVLTLGV